MAGMPIRRARRLAASRRRNPSFDEATTKLLMQARKHANASWGPKQWKTVLEALGFGVKIGKEGNSVVRFEITAPNGTDQLVIEKEPRYRYIVFYNLGRWMKEIGLDLSRMASEALGLPDPDEEKRLKKLYSRDLVNTGTCGVCEGNYKLEGDGGMHVHGYTRPGDGYIHGRCFGVGFQPHELSPKAAKYYLEKALEPELETVRKFVDDLKGDRINEFSEVATEWTGKGYKSVTKKITRDNAYKFRQAREASLFKSEQHEKFIAAEVARFRKKVADWRLDDLPEVKHARRGQ